MVADMIAPRIMDWVRRKWRYLSRRYSWYWFILLLGYLLGYLLDIYCDIYCDIYGGSVLFSVWGILVNKMDFNFYLNSGVDWYDEYECYIFCILNPSVVMSMETILAKGMVYKMGLTMSPYSCTYTMTESKLTESTMHLYVCL